MEREIPIYFENVSFKDLTPVTPSLPNVGKTSVYVFTKGANRNGSYITDEVADMLIASAINGTTPVVGFYSKDADDFTTHTSEDLCSAYGYCNGFEGWFKKIDEDGIEREYATFSVILFTDYFSAAQKIIGNPQSMELSRESISGQWQEIDGKEYYVYSAAKMRGFTVLGKNVEPCFIGSAFFNKSSRFEKFSALLSELKEKVDSLEKEGGTDQMIFSINGLENEHYAALFEKLNPNYNEENNFVLSEVVYNMTEDRAYTFACDGAKKREYKFALNEEGALEFELVEERDLDQLVADFAALEQTMTSLQEEIAAEKENFAKISDEFEASKTTYSEERENFEARVNELSTDLEAANAKIAKYEAKFAEIEEAKKSALIDSYQESISEEAIQNIRGQASEFSYAEVESKLAVEFARANLKSTSTKIPNAQSAPEESAFERLMKNYKR